MKWLKRLAAFCLFLYLAACAALYFGQESMLFHPRRHAADHSYGNYREEWVETDRGSKIHALHLRPRPNENAETVVLYLHGNVGDNGRSVYQTSKLAAAGYDLFLVDYPGYGKSDGQLTGEADLTQALQAAYDRVAGEYGEQNIILLGYSMGTGPASYLAAENDPRGAVLVAPYESLTAMKDLWFWMFPDFLLKYPMDNAARLARAKTPITLVHGTADELIPFAMSERLRAMNPERIELLPLPGGSHRGAILSPTVVKAVDGLARE